MSVGQSAYPLLVLLAVVAVIFVIAIWNVFGPFPRKPSVAEGEVQKLELPGWRVKVRFLRGRWCSPFVNLSGEHFYTTEPDPKWLASWLKHCLKDDKFRDQRNELEARGDITRLPEAAERSRS